MPWLLGGLVALAVGCAGAPPAPAPAPAAPQAPSIEGPSAAAAPGPAGSPGTRAPPAEPKAAPPKAPEAPPQAAKPRPAKNLDEATERAAARLKALQERGSGEAEPSRGPETRELRDRYELLLSLPGTPKERKPEILLRLAELAYREEEAALRGAYESQGGPVRQAVRYPQAVAYYRKLVDGYPNSPQALTGFYNLGYLYAEEGKAALSAWAYEQVLQRDPTTPYADEIHMRLGEAAFDGDDVKAAIPHYKAVVERGNPEYADKAFYKLGWSYYNLDDYEKAVDAFSRVMDRERAASEDLRRETLEIMARSFVEWGGVAGAAAYLAKHPKGAGYGDRLYRAMGELYADASKFDDAVKAYAAGVDAFPASPECLAMEKGILAALIVLRDVEGANQRRESWPARYGPGSPWETANRSAPVAKEARVLVEEGLRLAALYRHSQAQRGQGSLGRAVELYEQYLKLFGADTEEGYEVSYSYAQALKEAGRLADAQERYAAVAADPKRSAHREEASYRRIEVLQTLRQTDPSLFDELLRAHETYAKLNPASPLVPQVLFAEAELLFGVERFGAAREVFARVAKLPGTDPLRLEALERVARCAFREGKYADAESEARKALAAPLAPETADRARKLVAFSIFKLAEELEAAGDRAGANTNFFRVAGEFPSDEVAQVALARAAENLKALGRPAEAADVYQRLARSYPGTVYAKSALGTSADLLASLGDWGRAARSYEDLYLADPETSGAEGALFAAGLAYEKAKAPAEAARVFAGFAERYPQEPRRAQALFREAEAHRAQGRLDDARARYRAAWEAAASGDEEVYRARAALALGDLALDEFRGTELKGDLEEALARKEALLEESLGHLARAASLPYADTLTAALYRTARAFEEMKEALLGSERPAELTPEEREQYDFLLEEKAAPLEEKAVEYYKKGVAAARRAKVHTEWVDRMYGRLEALVPWAYQRAEEPAAAWFLPPLRSLAGGAP